MRERPDGASVRKWGQLGRDPGQFNGLVAVAIGPGGDVFAVDRSNQRIQRFRPDGSFLEEFSIPEDAESTAGSRATWTSAPRAGPTCSAPPGMRRSTKSTCSRPPAPAPAAAVPAFRSRGTRSAIATAGSPSRLRAARRGGVAAPCGSSKGKTTIAKRSYRVRAGRRATVRLRPARRGRTILRRARKHRVTVWLQQDGRTVARRSVTLRR